MENHAENLHQKVVPEPFLIIILVNPLVWMFHSRKIENRLNRLHKRAWRVVYRDYNATFSELISKDKSVTIHQKNLQLLATEIFKTNKLKLYISENR